MNFKKITLIVTVVIIPVAIGLVLGYDYYAIQKAGTDASISSLLIKYSYAMPLIPFGIGNLLGILEGHLFWRMRANNDTIGTGIDKVK